MEKQDSRGEPPNQVARSEPLHEQVRRILWERIANGDVIPGERISDNQWALRLGMSRTPVREAMRKLEQEGVLKPLAGGGYELPSVLKEDMISLYDCRAALEALAAERVASVAGEELKGILSEIISDASLALQRQDSDALFVLNTKFHETIVKAAKNDHLEGLLHNISRKVHLYRKIILHQSKINVIREELYMCRLRKKQSEHQEIFSAIMENNPDLAAATMKAHLIEAAADMNMDWTAQ